MNLTQYVRSHYGWYEDDVTGEFVHENKESEKSRSSAHVSNKKSSNHSKRSGPLNVNNVELDEELAGGDVDSN